jgi:Uncharacterized protein conserved in bacteria (DUF2130)
MVRQPDATMQATPQDNQLLSKHRLLSLKPQLRLEWQAQDGQNETEQPDHSASLGDSITSSTRIRFSVHRVADPRFAIPLATALRQSLIDLTCSRQAQEGQQTKTELVYQYLTGPRFRHRIDAIVEKFTDMQADLDRERKTMMRLWAKREEQLKGVLDSTAGLYGDLQGIAGRGDRESRCFND